MEQIKVDLIPGRQNPVCHASQYDVGRVIRVQITDNAAAYTLDGTETITVEVSKPDGNFVTASCTVTSGKTYVDIVTTEQMTAVAGSSLCELKIEKGGDILGTLNFIMEVERDPIDGASSSESVIENLRALVEADVEDIIDYTNDSLWYDDGQIDAIKSFFNHNSGTSNDVTFTWDANNEVCTVNGTSRQSTLGFNLMYSVIDITPPFIAGRKATFWVRSSNAHLKAQASYFVNGSLDPTRLDLYDGVTTIELPQNATGFYFRLVAEAGGHQFDNDTIQVKVLYGNGYKLIGVGTSTADATALITKILTDYGECKLGPGVFGVTGIDMPEGSHLYGCGDATRIRLTTGTYAIKMASRCTVSDLQIEGNSSDITLSTTVTNRHGILWKGDFSSSQDKDNQPSYGTIDRVHIMRFTGGAITCDNTGPQVNHGLNVSNVSIYNCNAGINVAYYSEFHRFTNVEAYHCQYGAVNNGGNNMFVNCSFSDCIVGMICKMVDGSGRSKTNNTHGSAIGCVFNHIDRDDTTLGKGDAVHFVDTSNGFIFAGCQFFYSGIYLENSTGIVFGNCLFGSHKDAGGNTDLVPISIVNTDATNRGTFFNACNFTITSHPNITVTKTGSGAVLIRMDACYDRKGAAVTYTN